MFSSLAFNSVKSKNAATIFLFMKRFQYYENCTILMHQYARVSFILVELLPPSSFFMSGSIQNKIVHRIYFADIRIPG